MNNINENILEQCYVFGKNYYGPLLYGFVRWLSEEIKSSEDVKVFFLSRDGYMMKKAYDYYSGHSNTKYFYVSRNSLRQSLFYKCKTFQETLQYLTEERYISYSKILKYYGFNDREQREIAIKYDISLSAEIAFEEINNSNTIKAIYKAYENLIVLRSGQKANTLKKYLSQEGFEGRCTIVDIGWHGSMQYYLEKFTSGEGIDAKINGLYLGINPRYKTKGSMKGFLFSSSESRNRKKVLCFLGGYEKLFQSQEGSTIGYEEINDRVFPVLEKFEYIDNENYIKRIVSWQKGAMDYLKNAHQGFSNNTLINPLLKFGANPPLWGVKMFEGFFIKDGGMQMFVSSKPIYQYTPNELMHTLSNSVWKTGFMKSLIRIPFPYFYIYELIRK